MAQYEVFKAKVKIFLGSFFLTGCAFFSTGSKYAVPVKPQTRNVAFDVRNSLEAPRFKPRLLVLRSQIETPTNGSEEWLIKAEAQLWQSLEKSNVFALVKPVELGISPGGFSNQGKWDREKVLKVAKEKSVPMILEWDLMPIRISQETDPIGFIRQRRRQIIIETKGLLLDSRKGIEILNDSGIARQDDKDLLWLARNAGKISLADFDPANLEILLSNSIEDLVPRISAQATRVSWTGRVALIKGDRVFLNVGRQSGLQIGDILKVLDVSDEIFDPESGDSIGKVPGRMKGTLEVINYFGQDGAVAVIHSGAGFHENDSIEFY